MTAYAYLMVDLVLHTVQPLAFSHHGVQGLPTIMRGLGADGQPQRTVYLPAGQLRGRLRHEAALALMRSKGGQVTLEEAYLLALGQDLRPVEDDEPESVRLGDQIAFRRENPFLDLFGTWKVASRLYVSHLMPEVNVAPERVSHIRRDLDSSQDAMAMLGVDQQDRMYDRKDRQATASKLGAQIKAVESALRAARKAGDTGLVDELRARLADLELRRKTHKGDDESENTKHLVDLHTVPAGLDLLGRLTIRQPQVSDLITLLEALQGISRSPLMGAQRARGCGEVRGKATFRTACGQVLGVVHVGGFMPAVVAWTDAGRAFSGEALAG